MVKVKDRLAMVAETFKPSTQEVGAGKSLWVSGQPGLQGELQDSQNHIERSCLRSPPTKKKRKQNKKQKKRGGGEGEGGGGEVEVVLLFLWLKVLSS